MFFEEKTDNESTSESSSHWEYSSSECEKSDDTPRDTFEKIRFGNLICTENHDVAEFSDAETDSDEGYQNNAKKLEKTLLNEKIERLLHGDNVLELVAYYLTVLRWNDLSEQGKAKIKNLIELDICSKISTRKLETILPCSNATIQRLKAEKKGKSDLNIDRKKNQSGRHRKLSAEQVKEFLAEATRKRNKFEPVSLKWGHEFIFKRFILTVSLPSVQRIFKQNNWRRRKVQKRNPKMNEKTNDLVTFGLLFFLFL